MFFRQKHSDKKPVYNQPENLRYWEFADKLLKEPHVLIAGTTGSGKSTLINDILYTLSAYSPQNKEIILIDLKRVELKRWKKLPHVKACVTEPEQVIPLLNRVIDLMEYRYRKMEMLDQTRSTDKDLYVVIDELAEVIKIKEEKTKLNRNPVSVAMQIDKLMRLSRAARIHLILATQIPNRSASGIPATIFANVSCSIGLRCRSAIESRQIINTKGCEELPRYGLAYILNTDGLTLQEIPLTSDEEIQERIAVYNTNFKIA